MLELLGLVVRNWSSVTGGSRGFLMPLPTWDVSRHSWPFYYALLTLVVCSVAMTVWIRRSKFGLGLFAIRDDESKAEGIGIVTPVYKSLAFMASAVLVGVAGAVYGYYLSILTVSAMFDIVLSMQIVLAVLLGGKGTIWGPLLGAAIVVPLNEYTNTTLGGADTGAIRLVMFGGLLLAVVLVLPRGILPAATDLRNRIRRGDASGLTGARLADTEVPATPARINPVSVKPGDDLLTVDDVTMRFGGVTALDHATLTVRAGSVTALIGPNGSGKTTVFNVVDGTYRPESGSVTLDGGSLDGLNRTRRAFAGVARTYQLPRLFDTLTVLENVAVVDRQTSSSDGSAGAPYRVPKAPGRPSCWSSSAWATTSQSKATDLSYGQRKLVELAQVLMLDPAVILLDEPAAGINPTLLRRLADADPGPQRVRPNLRDRGARHALRAAARRHRHRAGPRLGNRRGGAAAVSSDRAVLEAYLGDDFVLDDTGSAAR